MVSKAVMSDPRLNTTVKALYAYLSTYADGLTNELTVSVNRMAAELGITPPTVKRNLKLLEESGVIKRIPNGVMTTRITVLLK